MLLGVQCGFVGDQEMAILGYDNSRNFCHTFPVPVPNYCNSLFLKTAVHREIATEGSLGFFLRTISWASVGGLDSPIHQENL